VSDTREPSNLYIDRVIWAVLVIAIVRLSSQAYNRCQTYKRIIKNKCRNPVSRTAAGTIH
jgi:hypothetical protein